MLGESWLAYFESNQRKDCPPGDALYQEVPAELRAPVVTSLGRFQLGESAGGRIHGEVNAHPDPLLDAAWRRSIQLYIEEEWRHARELGMVIESLGGELQRAHWTNGAFTACRRLLGLRTKMLTLAIAEVVGIVYYRALARGVGSAELAASLERIASEEGKHLDFQAAFFERAVARSPLRAGYRVFLRVQMFLVFSAAMGVLLVDHGCVLRAVGARPSSLVRAAWRELHERRFLTGTSGAGQPRPGTLAPASANHVSTSTARTHRPGFSQGEEHRAGHRLLS
jgi:hypothetical protein